NVRVCGLPLTQQSPCLPLATITDINGNAISNSIGANFGQLNADVTGRYTFGCTLGNNYQVQITQSASNTPASNYPITCPGASNNPNFASLNVSGAATVTGNLVCSSLSGIICITATGAYTTLQAGYNALPSRGGIIIDRRDG